MSISGRVYEPTDTQFIRHTVKFCRSSQTTKQVVLLLLINETQYLVQIIFAFTSIIRIFYKLHYCNLLATKTKPLIVHGVDRKSAIVQT